MTATHANNCPQIACSESNSGSACVPYAPAGLSCTVSRISPERYAVIALATPYSNISGLALALIAFADTPPTKCVPAIPMSASM
jgi:hypothetical protein